MFEAYIFRCNGFQNNSIYMLIYFDRSSIATIRFVPFGLRKVLNWIKDKYHNVTVYVTEAGFPDDSGTLQDNTRVKFYKEYVNEVLKGAFVNTVNNSISL